MAVLELSNSVHGKQHISMGVERVGKNKYAVMFRISGYPHDLNGGVVVKGEASYKEVSSFLSFVKNDFSYEFLKD